MLSLFLEILTRSRETVCTKLELDPSRIYRFRYLICNTAPRNYAVPTRETDDSHRDRNGAMRNLFLSGLG
jgi:hypothetical protein